MNEGQICPPNHANSADANTRAAELCIGAKMMVQ